MKRVAFRTSNARCVCVFLNNNSVLRTACSSAVDRPIRQAEYIVYVYSVIKGAISVFRFASTSAEYGSDVDILRSVGGRGGRLRSTAALKAYPPASARRVAGGGDGFY